MELKWLESFLALCELRNFSRAAESQHITQPAFGRQIRALEEAVGKQLVDRSTTPVSLTSEGRQFRSLARGLTEQWKSGLEALNQVPHANFKPVRLATPHSLSTPILLDLLEPAFDMAFAVDILRVDLAVEALMQGECDLLLAFDILSLMQPPYLNWCLGQGDFLLVGATDATGQPLYTATMPRIPYLRYSVESFSARLIERQVSTPAPPGLQPVFESSMCQIHKEMVMRGRGVAWLPDYLIRDELAQGLLAPLSPEQWRVPYQIRLYRHRGPLNREAENLWQALSRNLEANGQ